jgi:DNA repair photolyase
MIISASRRTDIPAFFSDWFYNRIAEGHLLVRNPINRHLVNRVNLSPEVVDCIVFWSKNPYRMMDRLQRLRDYIFYFQYTLTGYGQRLEPNVPSWLESVAVFRVLSEIIGKDRIIWRYDPIILSEQFNIMYHADRFEQIARQLSGKTRQCVISFVDMYKKSKRNMASLPVIEIQVEQVIEVAVILSKISSEYGIELTSCAETVDLEQYGINHGKCIDNNIIEEICGFALDLDKDPTQRSECGCVASVDIGTYNTCAHECLYCYANYNHNLVLRNYAIHDPRSPLLFGEIGPGDKIYERKMVSCKKLQSLLF